MFVFQAIQAISKDKGEPSRGTKHAKAIYSMKNFKNEIAKMYLTGAVWTKRNTLQIKTFYQSAAEYSNASKKDLKTINELWKKLFPKSEEIPFLIETKQKPIMEPPPNGWQSMEVTSYFHIPTPPYDLKKIVPKKSK